MTTTKKQTDPNVAVDPLVNKPADTRTEREKFVDEFTQRYQDKNPKEQCEAILWAIDQALAVSLLEKESKK